jgi:hypothetical protein
MSRLCMVGVRAPERINRIVVVELFGVLSRKKRVNHFILKIISSIPTSVFSVRQFQFFAPMIAGVESLVRLRHFFLVFAPPQRHWASKHCDVACSSVAAPSVDCLVFSGYYVLEWCSDSQWQYL